MKINRMIPKKIFLVTLAGTLLFSVSPSFSINPNHSTLIGHSALVGAISGGLVGAYMGYKAKKNKTFKALLIGEQAPNFIKKNLILFWGLIGGVIGAGMGGGIGVIIAEHQERTQLVKDFQDELALRKQRIKNIDPNDNEAIMYLEKIEKMSEDFTALVSEYRSSDHIPILRKIKTLHIETADLYLECLELKKEGNRLRKVLVDLEQRSAQHQAEINRLQRLLQGPSPAI